MNTMNYTLTATTRKLKGPHTRFDGQLPGVVYGAKGPATSVALSPSEFLKLYRQAGEASLIDIMLDGANAGKVLVQDVQYDPVSDYIIHVDLRRIDMHKEMTATVALRLVGEAPVVKASGGTIVATIDEVEVKCLPKDLVSHIDVDLSTIASYEDIIKIKDLKIPAGITITSPHAEDLVVKATRALTEEEIKKMEEEAASADITKIELAKKKPEEEEVAVEGEAKAGEVKKDDKAAKAPEAKKDEKK